MKITQRIFLVFILLLSMPSLISANIFVKKFITYFHYEKPVLPVIIKTPTQLSTDCKITSISVFPFTNSLPIIDSAKQILAGDFAGLIRNTNLFKNIFLPNETIPSSELFNFDFIYRDSLVSMKFFPFDLHHYYVSIAMLLTFGKDTLLNKTYSEHVKIKDDDDKNRDVAIIMDRIAESITRDLLIDSTQKKLTKLQSTNIDSVRKDENPIVVLHTRNEKEKFPTVLINYNKPYTINTNWGLIHFSNDYNLYPGASVYLELGYNPNSLFKTEQNRFRFFPMPCLSICSIYSTLDDNRRVYYKRLYDPGLDITGIDTGYAKVQFNLIELLFSIRHYQQWGYRFSTFIETALGVQRFDGSCSMQYRHYKWINADFDNFWNSIFIFGFGIRWSPVISLETSGVLKHIVFSGTNAIIKFTGVVDLIRNYSPAEIYFTNSLRIYCGYQWSISFKNQKSDFGFLQ